MAKKQFLNWEKKFKTVNMQFHEILLLNFHGKGYFFFREMPDLASAALYKCHSYLIGELEKMAAC